MYSDIFYWHSLVIALLHIVMVNERNINVYFGSNYRVCLISKR